MYPTESRSPRTALWIPGREVNAGCRSATHQNNNTRPFPILKPVPHTFLTIHHETFDRLVTTTTKADQGVYMVGAISTSPKSTSLVNVARPFLPRFLRLLLDRLSLGFMLPVDVEVVGPDHLGILV